MLVRPINQTYMPSRCITYQIHQFGGVGVIITRVRKVETGDGHPGGDEFVDHFFGVGGRAEGAD